MRNSSAMGVAAVLAALAMPAAVAAQAYAGDGGNDVLFRDRVMASTPQLDASLVGDGRYVVVHLAENRVYVFDGDQAIWSAPAGTGTVNVTSGSSNARSPDQSPDAVPCRQCRIAAVAVSRSISIMASPSPVE